MSLPPLPVSGRDLGLGRIPCHAGVPIRQDEASQGWGRFSPFQKGGRKRHAHQYQGLCIIRESYVEKAPPFVMLEHSEASQGGASQLQKTPCRPEILRRPNNS